MWLASKNLKDGHEGKSKTVRAKQDSSSQIDRERKRIETKGSTVEQIGNNDMSRCHQSEMSIARRGDHLDSGGPWFDDPNFSSYGADLANGGVEKDDTVGFDLPVKHHVQKRWIALFIEFGFPIGP